MEGDKLVSEAIIVVCSHCELSIHCRAVSIAGSVFTCPSLFRKLRQGRWPWLLLYYKGGWKWDEGMMGWERKG